MTPRIPVFKTPPSRKRFPDEGPLSWILCFALPLVLAALLLLWAVQR